MQAQDLSGGDWKPTQADSASSQGNGLLNSMGPEAAARLLASGRRISLAAGETLWSPGEQPNAVCFPSSGLLIGLAIDAGGAGAQVDCVGPEGCVGLTEALAGRAAAFEARALINTEAWLVSTDAVRQVMSQQPCVAEILQNHVADLYDAVRYAAACSARHALRARLADCLLAYKDKTALSRLPVTQEMLSAILGANRTTVTALAIGLSDAGLTRTGRGWISIIDADRLDRLACGCRKAAEPRSPART